MTLRKTTTLPSSTFVPTAWLLLNPSFVTQQHSHLPAFPVEAPLHASAVQTLLSGPTLRMSSDFSTHDFVRSPTPLAQWPTKAQASANKGKKPIYPHRSWVRGRDPSPAVLNSNASSPEKLSLLARMSSPPSNGVEEDACANGSGCVEGPGDARRWGEVEEIGEVTQLPVAGEKLQDELPAQAITSGVQIKTEETPVIIPPPTRSEFPVARKRGSRSTIDVFGEPTVSLPNERLNSITILPKEEEMPVDFSSNGVIDVDAFLATVSPAKHRSHLVSSPPPMSPVLSDASNQTPARDVSNSARTSPVAASSINSRPSLHPPTYPQAVLDQCRNILVPLVERNAKLRKPGVDEEVVKRRAFKLLSDKLCADFIKLAKQVREQISVPVPPQRIPSTDDVQGQKRGRERSHDSPGPPRKVVKLESPKEMVFNDDVVSTTSPGPSASAAPVEDIQMGDDIENISPEHPSELLMSGTGVDVILPPSSREPSAAPPRPSSAADQHLAISTTEREARTATEMPLPLQENTPASSSNHVESGSPSVHAAVAAREEEDEASPSLPASIPSNTEPGPVTLSASRPSSRSPSPPYVNDASITDVAAEPGARSHESEVDHAASDISRLDAESVTRILDAASEDEQVAGALNDAMRHEQSADTTEPPVVYPSCLVPGVWRAVMGQPRPQIETIDFFVDDATADAVERWSRRHDSLSLNERHVAVHLLCASNTTVEEILQDPGLSPEDIAHGLFDCTPDWPLPGQLVVELNSDPNPHGSNSKPDSHGKGKSWIVQRPTPWTTHLDITPYVRRGHNTLHLIQLAGLSDRLFAIHAAEPSEEEKTTIHMQSVAWLNIKTKWARETPLSSPRNLTAKPIPKSSSVPASGQSTPPETPDAAA